MAGSSVLCEFNVRSIDLSLRNIERVMHHAQVRNCDLQM